MPSDGEFAVHDDVDRARHRRYDEGRVDVAAGQQGQGAEFREGIPSTICVKRAHTRQPAVEGDEQVERLSFAHLTDDETVRAHAQCLLDEAAQADLTVALEIRTAALHGDAVGGAEVELERLLHRDDAFVRASAGEKRAEHRRLTRLRSARDEDVAAGEHGRAQKYRALGGDRAELDQPAERADALRELAHVDCPVAARDVGDDHVQAGAVGQRCVDEG